MLEKLPTQLKERLEKQFGVSTTAAIIAAFNCQRLPTFRVNTLKTTDNEVMETLRQKNIQFERLKDLPHAFKIKNRTDREILDHPLCHTGKIYLQGIASLLPPIILDPKPEEKILDLCAAPGSKTSQIAAMLGQPKPGGEILACEENEIRFQKLQNTLKIQGAYFVQTKYLDASLLYKERSDFFDKILADVPCSAEGRIDLHDPRSYRFWKQKNIVAHAKIQRRLLRSAVACLKPGGIMVYSTCTLAPEEDGDMVTWLLETYPELKTESFSLPFVTIRPGPHNSQYVLPSKDNEGLFVAKFIKSKKVKG